MNNVRMAALKIALILEEYKPEELSKAISILRSNGRSGVLLDYFADEQQRPLRGARKAERSFTSQEQSTHSEQRYRALSKLKDSDPEKFSLLSDLESLIKSGRILRTNEEIKKLGERVSKKFLAKKSRKESIVALFDVLVDCEIEEIRNIIEVYIVHQEHAGDDEYRRLAEFLIKGKE